MPSSPLTQPLLTKDSGCASEQKPRGAAEGGGDCLWMLQPSPCCIRSRPTHTACVPTLPFGVAQIFPFFSSLRGHFAPFLSHACLSFNHTLWSPVLVPQRAQSGSSWGLSPSPWLLISFLLSQSSAPDAPMLMSLPVCFPSSPCVPARTPFNRVSPRSG